MSIAIIIPTLTAGGAERVASILANNWAAKFSDKVYLILLFEDKIFYDVNEGVNVFCLGMTPNANKLTKIKDLIRASWLMRRFFIANKIGYAISFMNKYNIFSIVALFGSPVKLVVSERDSPTEDLSNILILARNFWYRYSSGIICQTLQSRDYIKKQVGVANVVAIPNPVKPFDRGDTRKEELIVSVGRLVEKKGQSFLIEAFSKIKNKNWRLAIVGGGYLEGELKKIAFDLGVDKRVLFVGETKDVALWLNKASIFAFPSLWEGFPNALAEAMCSGIPAVSFDCDSGPRDIIIDGENGFLVPLRNVEIFSDKLNLLCENKEMRIKMGEQAKLVVNLLDADFISSKYYKYIVGL